MDLVRPDLGRFEANQGESEDSPHIFTYTWAG